jgi:hypothetical protein
MYFKAGEWFAFQLRASMFFNSYRVLRSILEVKQKNKIHFWDQTRKREVEHVKSKRPDGGAEAAKEVKEYYV